MQFIQFRPIFVDFGDFQDLYARPWNFHQIAWNRWYFGLAGLESIKNPAIERPFLSIFFENPTKTPAAIIFAAFLMKIWAAVCLPWKLKKLLKISKLIAILYAIAYVFYCKCILCTFWLATKTTIKTGKNRQNRGKWSTIRHSLWATNKTLISL